MRLPSEHEFLSIPLPPSSVFVNRHTPPHPPNHSSFICTSIVCLVSITSSQSFFTSFFCVMSPLFPPASLLYFPLSFFLSVSCSVFSLFFSICELFLLSATLLISVSLIGELITVEVKSQTGFELLCRTVLFYACICAYCIFVCALQHAFSVEQRFIPTCIIHTFDSNVYLAEQ